MQINTTTATKNSLRQKCTWYDKSPINIDLYVESAHSAMDIDIVSMSAHRLMIHVPVGPCPQAMAANIPTSMPERMPGPKFLQQSWLNHSFRAYLSDLSQGTDRHA